MSAYLEKTNIALPPEQEGDQKVQDQLELLKSLLLDEERQQQEVFNKDLTEIKQILSNEEFKKLVAPIVTNHLDDLKSKFPDLYGDVVREAIAKQVHGFEDEMTNALYPIVGKMIKKYVSTEIAKWLEVIEQRTTKIPILVKAKNLFKRKKGKDIVKKLADQQQLNLQKTFFKQIEEVFIVDKYAGFVIASFSEDGPFYHKKDMLVGLLTAIKSFGEDAISEKKESLSTIQYDKYNIVIIDFHKHYAATVVNGPITNRFQSDLHDRLLDYAHKYLHSFENQTTQYNEQQLSNALKELIK